MSLVVFRGKCDDKNLVFLEPDRKPRIRPNPAIVHQGINDSRLLKAAKKKINPEATKKEK